MKSLKTGGRNGSFDTVVQIIVALIIPSSGECQVLSAAVPVFVLYGLSNGPVHFIIDISIRNLLSSSLWPVSQLFLSCFVSNNSTTKKKIKIQLGKEKIRRSQKKKKIPKKRTLSERRRKENVRRHEVDDGGRTAAAVVAVGCAGCRLVGAPMRGR